MDKAKVAELIHKIRQVGDPADKGRLLDELEAVIAGKEEKPKKKKK